MQERPDGATLAADSVSIPSPWDELPTLVQDQVFRLARENRESPAAWLARAITSTAAREDHIRAQHLMHEGVTRQMLMDAEKAGDLLAARRAQFEQAQREALLARRAVSSVSDKNEDVSDKL